MLGSGVQVGSDKMLHVNWGTGSALGLHTSWYRDKATERRPPRLCLLAMPNGPGAGNSDVRPGTPSPGPVRTALRRCSHKALEQLSPWTELDLWGPPVALPHFRCRPSWGTIHRGQPKSRGPGAEPVLQREDMLTWALLALPALHHWGPE